METMKKILGVLIIGLGLYGCASNPKLSQEQIHKQYPAIAQLEQAVQTAHSKDLNLLAPRGFANADQKMSDAYSAAKKGQSAAAEKYANQGLESIDQAYRSAANSADILNEVLEVRARALLAGAHDLYPKDLTDLDKDLGATAEMIEKGEVEEAKQTRPELRKHYADLELKALKKGTVQKARDAIAHARSTGANKLAPRTYQSAQESLAAAISILEADRTARDRAEAAAQLAMIQAERSENVSEIVRDFKRRDFEPEDIVLWYQDQLSKVATPLDKPMNFNEPNKKTVGDLQDYIASLMKDRQRLAETDTALAETKTKLVEMQKQHEQEMASLKQEFAGEKTVLTQAQREREARFKKIQNMFNNEEATVYRQGDNVLISVHGFKFPPGSSEIQPQNFGIMNKIVQGINAFKAAKVLVEGHTDATGSDQVNLTLSEQRAQNVARFLTDVGHIPADRVVSEGYGSERPVATNATPEGRAENRRIEVLIVNE